MFINSFISWIGGKKALRNVIYRLFPKNYGRYIEVFGGSGWVLFGKKPDQNAMEVYNDFNSNLANLFYCVQTRTWEFLRHLGFLPINSRDETVRSEYAVILQSDFHKVLFLDYQPEPTDGMSNSKQYNTMMTKYIAGA